MTVNEFIEKWNVGYEDLEQKSEFAAEMKSDLESLNVVKYIPYQCCPICNGLGVVTRLYSSAVYIDCPTCKGQRIIPQHIIK